MSGATPDPTEPARDPDAVSRLQLTQALQRAKYAIAWERGWPHLARLLTRRRAVSGGVLGRTVAGAAVCRRAPSGSACSCCWRWRALFPLVRFRWPSREEAPEPARPRHRHPPSPGDRADRYAGHAGSGRAGAVAGAARAHAGLDQAHPRRPAVAAAGDPRSLGAARAGRGDDGRGLCRRRRRAHDARRGGVRLERRAVAGQCPGRCLGDAAALYRQAADHPVGGEQGSRRCRPPGRCRFRRAAR